MAKNATQLGDILSLDPGATVSSGDLISVGTLPSLIIGVAIADGVSGTACPVAVKGVFDVAKTTGAAWAVGATVYFDGGTGKGTVNADGSPAFGVCVEAAGSSATSGKVRLINSGADFAPRVLSNGQVAFTAATTATATVAAALAGKVVRYHCQTNDGTHALISGAIAGTTLTITASGSMTGKVYYDVLDVDVA